MTALHSVHPRPNLPHPVEYQQRWLKTLRTHRVIAVIRAETVESGLNMALAAAEGGIHLLEITWNSYQPVALLQAIQQAIPHCTVGVGTILTEEELRIAIATGAQFCFSPHTSLALLNHGRTVHIPTVAGAMTPTEILTAWEAGATSVKVFPIKAFGGATYLQCLRGPFGHIPLIPSGGVTVENAAELLASGATAVGISSGLFTDDHVRHQDWKSIQRQAHQLTQMIESMALTTEFKGLNKQPINHS
ncbi:bifunctional 4-hydroxy-2-oxoglutarate aldolase/2-dehydro-3-deoxy-phosphogluconate aldolase [Leptothoe spongobia]|uniref:Bifunctional 4-hydroxy-2-oxoglutarate aldolase/2-dehydro-3-deoxy-phosphogluconate aldolase n=1 Tax=Leptothoe spongobia TAU-MAC 1115 TaxID=1967444 RepID=A0A947DAB3_9CYAN|nr:bifunctional 4-hydroxy-2-oxoglutarate aldolase/2-dehydro-3-deoxy-phosphogluconate aldolase [Leptothoe spongobia]MBT9313822.1 bifunctional 4-hydroxy-2-oxoglutarate aldolase/2-dehydro-3-deoxy-phosphogluconate aldolase [Leptothoe spongobia TAU-MAC 1115]